MKAGMALLMLGVLLSQHAAAEPARRMASRVAVLPYTEQVGCYWYRERQFCSRYCYWEVNGKRYCREREREAHSQAPVDEVYPYASMKLGRGLKDN